MVKRLLKKVLSQNFILPFVKGKRFVFIYHDISAKSSIHYSKHYSTTPENFIQQLTGFKKHFKMLGLDELVSDDLDEKCNYATVVFDDGFKSVLDIAAPILTDLGIPFAVFVNKDAILNDRLWVSDVEMNDHTLLKTIKNRFGADLDIEILKASREFNDHINYWIGSERKADDQRIYLNQDEVKLLNQRGVVIGSHTVHHPVLANCSIEVQYNEISKNKKFIDELLNQDTQHFAFPFGKKEHFNGQTCAVLEEVGHRYWYTSNPVCFDSSVLKGKLIPRIGVLNDSPEQLMMYINRQFLRKIEL